MMNAYSDHARLLDDLQTEQDDGSLTFNWNDADWKILPGGAKFGRKNDFGGFALSCDLKLTCTTKQFNGNLPQAAESVTCAGLNYTIKTVSTAPESYQLEIELDLNVGEK